MQIKEVQETNNFTLPYIFEINVFMRCVMCSTCPCDFTMNLQNDLNEKDATKSVFQQFEQH